ncbi:MULTISPECIES: DUF2470 domain-containing protein [Streptomyces]|uniref:DUF2470 domain-containing protein n=1 Tax=Streptomyces albus (strain ATCC 21838 / DSM 41398 / FERM P-419 / JCM 4703 / NBRC 107858) TaxID=1081613 RepID=A0A0B5EVN0_STRA4|nr:DUF2470 domain-containing protein [Streptomyces sp. SCSIO ZS0520]AJE82741.1 hypothetical protein SLNWT_2365 [Streptomyces albus]AOU77053.1 hypothetical protein SLNHY_2362 [Streptomyces albus]
MTSVDRSAEPKPAEPTPAERARSVLAAAGSLTVTTHGHRVELVGLHSVDAEGGLTLHDPPDSHLVAEVRAAPRTSLPAVMEFTDIAPSVVRDRVRARLTLAGSLAPGAEEGVLSFTLARACLEEHNRPYTVEPAELAAAEPDPLATFEADMLGHLDTAHADAVELLSRLLPVKKLLGVVRVRPLRLDRYGIVLRLERFRGSCDARLVFPEPATHAGEAVERLHLLLDRAAACPHRLAPRR